MSFTALGLPDPITRGVRAAGYREPTPVQQQAIPLILPGYDVVAAAQTGSGKTAAFLLPILTRLMEGPRAMRALVLVPTRELAAQVEAAGREYARYADVRVGAVYGGVPIPPQERMLTREGVELLVATPGRLLDLHERQSLSLVDIEVLVLDEADRMVDMGFAPDLRRILKLLPKNRQTLMFSATMPAELNRVASEALSSPRRLELAPPSKPAANVAQALYPVPKHLKVAMLDHILRGASTDCTIVFTRTKHGADRLGRQLKALGHDVAVIHGNRSQGQRERALRDFQRGRAEVLVATDIASRGIDVDDVSHVINFDVPHTPEDYVHRVGRTGRMDATGDAFTLMSPDERNDVAAIERFIGKTLQQVTVPGFDYNRRPEPKSAGHGEHARTGRGSRRSESHGSGRAASDRATPSHPHRPAGPVTHGRKPRPGSTDRRSRKRM